MTASTTGLRFASALSIAEHADQALAEVVDTLGEALGANADLAIVFATCDYADALGPIGGALNAGLGAETIIGCTARGVLGPDREIEQGPAISVLAARTGPVRADAIAFDGLHPPADIDHPTDPPAAVILLADPFSVPIVTMLAAIGGIGPDAACAPVPIVGGLISGGRQPGDNRLLINDAVRSEGCATLAIRGPVHVQTTISHGCRPVGKPWVITGARRHVVHELGGRNVLDVLQQTFDELDPDDRELAEHGGLQVGRVINEYQPHFGRGDFLIRQVVGVEPGPGYLAIGDPHVRIGQTIQFQIRDSRSATDDLSLLLDGQRLHGPADGALLFAGSRRGTELFERRHADAAMITDALGQAPLAGFFAAGEIGPVSGRNHLHSQTAALLAFRTRD